MLTLHHWVIKLPSFLHPTPIPLSFSDTLVLSSLSLLGTYSDSSPNAANRRAKNHEECKEADSASTSACQLDQMAIGLIQGPLKSM